MDYQKNIEPIHKVGNDELDHILNVTKECLEFLWYTPENAKNETTRKGAQAQSDYNLNSLIFSIKESLLHFYPEEKFWLSQIVNANEARHFIASERYSNTFRILLCEGIEAILKIYLFTGRQYYWKPDLIRLKDAKNALLEGSMLDEMRLAVLKYALHAREIDQTPIFESQKKKGQKNRTRKGLTPEEQKVRNMQIAKDFKNARLKNPRLTISAFLKNHPSKYNIKRRRIADILKKLAVGT